MDHLFAKIGTLLMREQLLLSRSGQLTY